MKKSAKILLSGLLWCCAALPLAAQQGTDAAGGNATGPGGSVSYSIGLVDFITASGPNGVITQGLQQPYEIYLVGIKDGEAASVVSVYPNPAGDYVVVDVGDMPFKGMHCALYDLHGRLCASTIVTGAQTRVSLVDLAKATYLLRVTGKEGEIQTFKVIKN